MLNIELILINYNHYKLVKLSEVEMSAVEKMRLISDKLIMSFILQAILDSKNATVEDMASTMLDPEGTEFSKADINWMKETKVKDVQVGSGDGTSFNISLGESLLTISDRSATRGEFRGGNVRNAIKAGVNSNPEQSLYDALTSDIQNLSKYANFIYAYTPVIGMFMAANEIEPGSDVAQVVRAQLVAAYSDLGHVILGELDRGEITATEKGWVNANNVIFDKDQQLTDAGLELLKEKLAVSLKKHVSQQLIDVVDNSDLANLVQIFDEQLAIIDENLQKFPKDSIEHKAATSLYKTLNNTRNGYLKGDIDSNTFENLCRTALNEAKNSPLKDHRGWKQVFATVGFVVISICSLSIANWISLAVTGSMDFSRTNTDSVKTLNKVESDLETVFSTKSMSDSQPESHDDELGHDDEESIKFSI